MRVNYIVQLVALVAAVVTPPLVYIVAPWWHSNHILAITAYLWVVGIAAWAWGRFIWRGEV